MWKVFDILRFAIMATTLAISTATLAQPTYPIKPIRLVVAFAPGSINDAVARELARQMRDLLGQSVIVENKQGAGGMLGTDAVAKAKPDGYVLGLGTSSQLVMNIGLSNNLPFDVDKDLASIGMVLKTQMLLFARADGPRTLKELIEKAKAAPNLNFA